MASLDLTLNNVKFDDTSTMWVLSPKVMVRYLSIEPLSLDFVLLYSSIMEPLMQFDHSSRTLPVSSQSWIITQPAAAAIYVTSDRPHIIEAAKTASPPIRGGADMRNGVGSHITSSHGVGSKDR